MGPEASLDLVQTASARMDCRDFARVRLHHAAASGTEVQYFHPAGQPRFSGFHAGISGQDGIRQKCKDVCFDCSRICKSDEAVSAAKSEAVDVK